MARKERAPLPFPILTQQLDLRGSVVYVQSERYFEPLLLLPPHSGDRRPDHHV